MSSQTHGIALYLAEIGRQSHEAKMYMMSVNKALDHKCFSKPFFCEEIHEILSDKVSVSTRFTQLQVVEHDC